MTESVLVLNANYEPINVCNLRRAIGLILTDKAGLVLDGRGVIKTTSNVYPKPTVIRLQQMVHRPRPHAKFSRREILRRDNFSCQYCSKQSPDLTIDHVLPRHLGGQQIWTNVVAACSVCNHRKGGRTIQEAGMHIIKQPKEPPISASYIFGRHLNEYIEWEPFLAGW